MPQFLDHENGMSFVSVMDIVKEKVVACERQVGSERGWHPGPLSRICRLIGKKKIILFESCDNFQGTAGAFGKRQNK